MLWSGVHGSDHPESQPNPIRLARIQIKSELAQSNPFARREFKLARYRVLACWHSRGSWWGVLLPPPHPPSLLRGLRPSNSPRMLPFAQTVRAERPRRRSARGIVRTARLRGRSARTDGPRAPSARSVRANAPRGPSALKKMFSTNLQDSM
jgi:hypothetical protein